MADLVKHPIIGSWDVSISWDWLLKCSFHLSCSPSKRTAICSKPLRWRHNGPDSVSNHQPHVCLLNRLFRRRSKETSKLRVTGLCVGNSPGPVNSPHKGPVTRKMFPFDDVIMRLTLGFGKYQYVPFTIILNTEIVCAIKNHMENKDLYIYHSQKQWELTALGGKTSGYKRTVTDLILAKYFSGLSKRSMRTVQCPYLLHCSPEKGIQSPHIDVYWEQYISVNLIGVSRQRDVQQTCHM